MGKWKKGTATDGDVESESLPEIDDYESPDVGSGVGDVPSSTTLDIVNVEVKHENETKEFGITHIDTSGNRHVTFVRAENAEEAVRIYKEKRRVTHGHVFVS